ncbi:type III effector [Echinicola strongylocentroti]|uniref:Type III effector n=1 Tax=Echinicola strongylocentroti TaxID=1795355 RepID=A0A2Z4INF7_9BACT|nr:HopJ type III effector protein [Echinicola strongylocentroti]AWW32287.1 type III effector [Echinicola strongylocentroti]
MNFTDKISQNPEAISFQETIDYIEENYHFTPTRFANGNTINEAGENNGSCKIFALGRFLCLSAEQTLNLFGDIYRKDVLGNPNGEDHQNIRNFIKSGWEGIIFEGTALEKK